MLNCPNLEKVKLCLIRFYKIQLKKYYFICVGESTCDIEMESYGYTTKDVVYEENTDNDAFLYEKVTQHLEWVLDGFFAPFFWKFKCAQYFPIVGALTKKKNI